MWERLTVNTMPEPFSSGQLCETPHTPLTGNEIQFLKTGQNQHDLIHKIKFGKNIKKTNKQ